MRDFSIIDTARRIVRTTSAAWPPGSRFVDASDPIWQDTLPSCYREPTPARAVEGHRGRGMRPDEHCGTSRPCRSVPSANERVRGARIA